MLKTDELYFRCLKEAENLIKRGYTDMPLEILTQELVKRMENNPNYQELLDKDFFSILNHFR